ncbi:tyrosine-type recombinase/integrase, partial [Candidatus Bathyarchaeota archaeon]|nr:tyrosine-type recombinase/integrase [Candidatus Bathyarchaeota archaeon]
KTKPPKSVQTWLAAVKSFLMENDVELPQRFWKRISKRIGSTRAVTEDIVPSNVQLRQILSHMRIKGKSFYLTLASSGMRIGELLKLKLDDVNFDVSPTRINIRAEYTKSGGRRYAFISDEATESLKEWLKIRDKNLRTAIGRSKHRPPTNKEGKVLGKAPKRSVKDERLFPFTKQSAYQIWNNALDNTKLNGMDERTNRHKIHAHVLRKFFRSRMATIIPVDIVEALMGHEGYLTEVYRRYTSEQLGEFYKKGEATVNVFGAIGVGEEFSKLKQEHAGLSSVVEDLVEDKKRLRNTIEALKGIVKEQGEADEQLKKVLAVLMKAPLGAIPNVKPTIDVKKLSDKEFKKWIEKEQGKYDKEMEEAMNIVNGWK